MKNIKELNLAEELKEITNTYHRFHESEIQVAYVHDMFEEAVYVDVILLKEGKHYDSLNIEGFRGKAHTYNASKDILDFLMAEGYNVSWKKAVYR